MGLSQGMEKRNSIEEIYVLRDAQDVVNAAMARCQERQFGKKIIREDCMHGIVLEKAMYKKLDEARRRTTRCLSGATTQKWSE